MESTSKPAVDAARPRRRFSDKLEFRRGQVDGRAGRAPACMVSQYLAGYTEGRRQLRASRKTR
ncbi:MAG: hypothetical protein AAFN74_05085 [Myxococcota bacterium]